jgi:hypothetical protein
MTRKIVFINQATGYLTIDIINSFARHFDKIALIAGSIRAQDIEIDNKVHLSKIIKYDRGTPHRKLLSWIIGTIQIFFLLAFKYSKYEVFYITIPPSAYLLSMILPNKFSVLIFDVYPDVLKIYNQNESGFIYRTWASCNRKLFAKAHRVFTIGKSMADLLSAYIPGNKIKIIPLWPGLTKVKPVPKSENLWLRNLDLQNKFIVQYSGNIGFTHNVEILIEVASRMRYDEDIHFLIIGRGERYNNILGLIETNHLTNCSLLPFQPDDVLVYSLAAADLSVVLLDEKTAHVSLPSKIFNIQAVAVPILGFSPENSELKRHLEEYNNGRCFRQSDINGIVGFIKEMKSKPAELRSLAENSGRAALFFSRENAAVYYRSYSSASDY